MNFKSFCTLMLVPCTAAVAGIAVAQEFPSKSVRLLVPFPPGGTADIIGRALMQSLSRALGQSVIVENRSGGNTVIGAELVARAPADGHTVLVIAPSFTINPYVRSKLPYDTLKDFSGVTRIASTAMVFSVPPSLPAKTLKELVALARAHPGELTFANASILGSQRLAVELFKETAKINLVNVPYNGAGPATTAVMGGHNSMLVTNVAPVAPAILSGKLRGVAVTSLTRSEVLPNVPTVAESGYPGFETLNWFGAVAREATPRNAIDRLNTEIARAMQVPEVKDILLKQGLEPAAMSPQEFDAFLLSEGQRYGRILKTLNVKIE